jgi:hypothetical protein
LTILLPMKPAIRPRMIQLMIPMVVSPHLTEMTMRLAANLEKRARPVDCWEMDDEKASRL